jgi:hypothetical protein
MSEPTSSSDTDTTAAAGIDQGAAPVDQPADASSSSTTTPADDVTSPDAPAAPSSSTSSSSADVDAKRAELDDVIGRHRAKVDEVTADESELDTDKGELAELGLELTDKIDAYVAAVESELEQARSESAAGHPVEPAPAGPTGAGADVDPAAVVGGGQPVDTATPDDKTAGADGVAVAL